jgi:preprotein translocase subunit SecB
MSNVKTISQYIKELSFDLPSAPQVFLTPQDKPNINLSIDIDAKKISKEIFEVSLKISANAQIENDQFFACKATYNGLFSIEGIEGEILDQILLIYCPNLLFPFLRRIFANITTDAGLSPLLIDPIDFTQLYNKKKKG